MPCGMENMKTLVTSAAIAALAAGSAQAGGLDRALTPYGALFEDGSYAELSFSSVSPKVQGEYPAGLGGGATGDMANDYSQFGFAYKQDLSPALSLGLFYNQPFGASAAYTQGPYTGLAATWESDQIAAVLKYRVNDRVSVFGGLKAVKSNAEIAIPDTILRGSFQDAADALSALPSRTPEQEAQLTQLNGLLAAPSLDYSAVGSADTQPALIIGAAYEIPDIALRVALSYETGFTHEIDTVETWAAFGAGNPLSTVTEIDLPQSLRLDFQSGVAQNTLVFGSIRWTEWSTWEVKPPGYFGVTNDNVTELSNDVMTYQIGVAQRFNESLSAFARFGYEKANGGVASRLTPTDGSKSLGVGLNITRDNINIRTGIEYVKVGDATDGSGVEFSGNDAIGFGVSVGINF